MILRDVVIDIGAGLNKKTVERIGEDIICETVIEEQEEVLPYLVERSSIYKTKTGGKTVTYKNNKGKVLWYVKVGASFKYNGSTSSCTAAAVTAAAPDNNWKIASKNCSKSGHTATARAVGKRYNGSTVVQTLTRTVSISCSKNGKLS